MKVSPGISKAFVLASTIAVTLFIQACAQFVVNIEHGIYSVIIRHPVRIKSEAAFTALLNHLKKPGVKYSFHLIRDDGTTKDFVFDSGVKITTDRIIVTEVAQSLPKDALTPIGASVTHLASLTSPRDVAKLLAQVESTN